MDLKTHLAERFGRRSEGPLDPEMQAMAMMHPEVMQIGEADVKKAMETLTKYKDGKKNLEQRVIENAQWFRLRHWDVLRRQHNQKCKEAKQRPMPEPTSGWLFNSIASHHADAMDNFPEPLVLPRERGDEETADQLSQILPVILELNNYPKVYRNAWWTKLIQGMAVYGVFWDPTLENGLGDISIKEIDLLRCYWEPGVTDIQQSHNFFITDLVDAADLQAAYPDLAEDLKPGVLDVSNYVFDDNVDTSEKVLVVDWYYHRKTPSGRRVLHLCKFCNGRVLFASENEPQYQERGWYEDDRYPVVIDGLFPEAGTPVYFGLVDICKDPQMYIDRLWSNILQTSDWGTVKKWFIQQDTDINEEDLMDPNCHLVKCSGLVSEDRLREIVTKPLDSIYVNIIQLKIDEMKDTSSNRDVNNGGGGSGVTAAAAISALQEAGNKTSRDMIKGGFEAQTTVYDMSIERGRQFYDVSRQFRITGDDGKYEFIDFSNAAIKEQLVAPYEGQRDYVPTFRKPVFDLKVSAQRKNPFSRMEQNERALNLYQAGFFAPENAQQALACLEMMEFEGIDKIRDKIREGQTLLNQINQMAQKMDMLFEIVAQVRPDLVGLNAEPAPAPGEPKPPQGEPAAGEVKASGGQTGEIIEAQNPKTSYMEATAKHSGPKV